MTFDREYFTGYIRKDGKDVIEWVTKIKVSGDSIYGERYFVNESREANTTLSLTLNPAS